MCRGALGRHGRSPVTAMNTAYPREYNYAHFDFNQEAAERAYWFDAAPRLGTALTDFALPTLDGEVWQLSAHLEVPVVIEIGSYTCPIFCGRIAAMDELAQSYPSAEFVVIYVREAHPGEVTPRHRTMADKLACARKLVRDEGLCRTILLDELDGSLHRSLGANYNPVFVLDPQGRVVLRRRWNEPSDVRRALADLHAGVRPVPVEAVNFGSSCDRQPAGVEMLQRGGHQAVADFAKDAPPGIRRMLAASAPEVREIAAETVSTPSGL